MGREPLRSFAGDLLSNPALRTHINRCVKSCEHNLQRKAIRRWQLLKGYDRLGEMAMAPWMGEHFYCEISGGVPTMSGKAVAVGIAEGSVIAIRAGTVVVAVAAVG